jgi:hypothetical protein
MALVIIFSRKHAERRSVSDYAVDVRITTSPTSTETIASYQLDGKHRRDDGWPSLLATFLRTFHPEVLDPITSIRETNDEIQKLVSAEGITVPGRLIKLLSDLDWALKNEER